MSTHVGYGKEDMREYMRAYRAQGRDNSLLKRINATGNYLQNLPFIGIDGEGGNLENGYHAYFLLSIGNSKLLPRSGDTRLRTVDVLRYLSELPRDSIYVGYYFDYDVTKILEDLPFAKLLKLMVRSKRARKNGKGLFPVEYAGYELDYLPRKEFKCRKIGTKNWTVINDVGSFFQCRFVEAIAKWDVGTAAERAMIGAGKDARGTFQYADIEDIAAYNALEIKLLQELMEKFRQACNDAGIVPRRWQGPGLLAEALFAANHVPASRDVSLFRDDRFTGLMDFARNAFYGGRPEIGVLGDYNRPVWQYDKNSAYPHAMLSVPCLVHGGWKHVTGSIPVPDGYALCYGRFQYNGDSVNPPQYFGLPFRSKKGTITFPASGIGWYWNFEIRSAKHQSFAIEEAWIYDKRCDCRPLVFTERVYRERKRMGKDGPGIVLKLALNSLYGKTVQSIGMPKYANPIWGSFITAHCRTAIQDFIHGSPLCAEGHCGQDVLMIATDSVCSTRERPDVTVGSELGEWSCEEHPSGMFLVQPGLYFGTSGKPPKTRGVPRSAVEEKEGEFRTAFARMCESRNLSAGDVWVSQKMFCGIRYALHRNNQKLLGQWIEFTDPENGTEGKRISFDWQTKRAGFPVLDAIPGLRPWLTTLPQWGDPDLVTVPYGKDIGGFRISQIRDLFEAQPDWGEDILSGYADAR